MPKNQKIQKKFERKNKGITLIALVITIIVLLILAGVALAAISGEDGILNKATHAKEENEKAAAKEKLQIALIASYGTSADLEDELLLENLQVVEGIDESTIPETTPITYPVKVRVSEYQFLIDREGKVLEIIQEPEQTPEPETGAEEFTMANGVIEIKWLVGNTNYVGETANAPKIKTDAIDAKMELVRYDETSESWISGTEYSYVAGSGTADNNASKWANARVTTKVGEENIESYFVWIPRYAYRIVYFDTPESKNAYKEGTLTEEEAVASGKIVGYSDSRGIVDKDGKKVDNVESTTKTNVGDYFMVHPAFTDGTSTGFENGEWNTELEGLWIGKYETARSNATNTSDGTETTIKVQPNVRSFRNDTIGNMYNYSISYSEDLKSHMLKNSEWGAVAYLTDSTYGRNGTEVTINNNSDYLTGQAGNSVSASESTDTNPYNTTGGVLASSTGNVYGIYDLSGGVYEYVASYYINGSTLSTGNSFTADKTSDEYSTVYEGTTENSNYKYGDATYETYNWNQDRTYFVYSNGPFFIRGGYFINGTIAGVFNFNRHSGNSDGNDGFRLCLAV